MVKNVDLAENVIEMLQKMADYDKRSLKRQMELILELAANKWYNKYQAIHNKPIQKALKDK